MITILFMVSIALVLSSTFVFCYLWALSNGQYDDMQTPALRMLKEDFKAKEQENSERKKNEE